jgi:hypothetical protein
MRALPPIYPWSAFESRRWLEARCSPIVPREPSGPEFSLHCQSEEMRHRLTSEFDRVNFERVGVLRGEFVVLPRGLALVDRAGAYISVNFPNETSAIARMPYEDANRRGLWDEMKLVRDNWDAAPLVENGALFSHIYHNNYYHFCFEFLQKFRLIEPLGVRSIVMPPSIYGGRVYHELIVRALGGRRVVPAGQLVRMKDPVIAQAYQSDDGLRWLRKLVGRTVQPQGRRYYVRRSPKHARQGNNIAESEDFLNFLRRHDFITIDFGNGELSVHEQIDKLQGASIILAPHGAGLTNLAHLNPPIRVIEIFSRAVISTSFIRISEALGLEHHAIISEQLDAQGDIVVDCNLLDRLVGRPVDGGAARPARAF